MSLSASAPPNIAPIDASSTLAALMQLNPVSYNWRTEAPGTPTHTGFIAQQVLPIFPDLVSQGPDGYYSLNYAGFTPYLVKAVQDIANISDAFKANLIAWLASADNGITDLFAKTLYATNVTGEVGTFQPTNASTTNTNKLNAQQLCETKSDGTSVCVTVGAAYAARQSG